MKNEINRYIRKPVEVMAVQVDSSNIRDVYDWCRGGAYTQQGLKMLDFDLSERGNKGKVRKVFVGNYVIRDEKGNYFSMTEEEFEREYIRKDVYAVKAGELNSKRPEKDASYNQEKPYEQKYFTTSNEGEQAPAIGEEAFDEWRNSIRNSVTEALDAMVYSTMKLTKLYEEKIKNQEKKGNQK